MASPASASASAQQRQQQYLYRQRSSPSPSPSPSPRSPSPSATTTTTTTNMNMNSNTMTTTTSSKTGTQTNDLAASVSGSPHITFNPAKQVSVPQSSFSVSMIPVPAPAPAPAGGPSALSVSHSFSTSTSSSSSAAAVSPGTTTTTTTTTSGSGSASFKTASASSQPKTKLAGFMGRKPKSPVETRAHGPMADGTGAALGFDSNHHPSKGPEHEHQHEHGPPPPSPPASDDIGETETMSIEDEKEDGDADGDEGERRKWLAARPPSAPAPAPAPAASMMPIGIPPASLSGRSPGLGVGLMPQLSPSSVPPPPSHQQQQRPTQTHRRQRSSTDSQTILTSSSSTSLGHTSTPVRTIVVTSPSPPLPSSGSASSSLGVGNVVEASTSFAGVAGPHSLPPPVSFRHDGSGYLHPQSHPVPAPNAILPSISSPMPTTTPSQTNQPSSPLLSPPVVGNANGKPVRRNTTGSTPGVGGGGPSRTSPGKGKKSLGTSTGHQQQHHHPHIRHGKGVSQPHIMPFDDGMMTSPTTTAISTAILGEGGMDMASDIEIHAERIRRERQEKRARAARDKEREYELLRDREREEAERKLTRREREREGYGEGEGAGVAVQEDMDWAAGGGHAHPHPHGHGYLYGAEGRVGRAESQGREKEKEREREQDMPLVGNLIGEDHVNYVLMYNMLTGIRIGVSRCQAKIKRPLTEEDFKGRHKFSFDIVGNELTPSAKYDFKFKDYAPWVFRYLREDIFALDPADYLLSLTAKYILSELGSPGKSGSFFYFSRDYRFIIKTIRHSEHTFLLSILERYYEYVKANPHTLLSRFYGLHRVKLPRGRKIHFVIMNNLFPAHKDIHETYDLKGSTVGREYPEDKALKNPRAVLKDLNWINRGNRLELGPEKRALLTEQLRRDEEFLKSVKVMDYSLLVGIHNLGRGNKENVRRNTLKVFSPNLPETSRRSKLSHQSGSKSPDAIAIAIRRAMRTSDPQRLGTNTHPLPLHLPDEEDTAAREHRRQFLFYADDGGLRATDEGNECLGDVVYYLGVIDILTPYGCVKRMEHLWKGMSADRHKISPVPPVEYGDRFFAFMKAIMRGGEGLERFMTKDKAKEWEKEKEREREKEKGEQDQEQERTKEGQALEGQEGGENGNLIGGSLPQEQEQEQEKEREKEKGRLD